MALKIGMSIGIGMLVGMEREWSNKDVGIRSFALVALFGMLAALMGTGLTIVSAVGVFLLVLAVNARSILTNHSLEITTSAALMVTYLLGALTGQGHLFTPVASAIIMTMLLAWKTELSRFAGGLQMVEIRSAVLLGLIGFVIYPTLPNRYIDPWQLFNPRDAWISVIAIAGIGFINYVFLRAYSTRGLYLSAVFGGLVNSTATVAEISIRTRELGMLQRLTALCLLTILAMFARNLILATLFSPASLGATLIPFLAMVLLAGIWMWRDRSIEQNVPGTLSLSSPISIPKVLRFGALFVAIQITGSLLTRLFGNAGMLTVSALGGLVSSASTTAAAATMAMHGKIDASVAGSSAIVASLSSAVIDLPIVWRITQSRPILRRLSVEILSVIFLGIAAVIVDRLFQISEALLRH